jgi:hypothetical protein
VYLWTLTFKEDVTDFREAKRRARPLADYIRRRGGGAVGVWEIQPTRLVRTGLAVWHLHAVLDVRLSVVELRPWLEARGWGRMCHVEMVHLHRDMDVAQKRCEVRRVARYLAKYMTKRGSGVEVGKQPTAWFVGRSKCGTVAFTWVGGLARLYRLGIGLYLQAQSLPYWRYLLRLRERAREGRLWAFRDFILRLGLEEIWGAPEFAGYQAHPCLGPPQV